MYITQTLLSNLIKETTAHSQITDDVNLPLTLLKHLDNVLMWVTWVHGLSEFEVYVGTKVALFAWETWITWVTKYFK